MARAPGFSIILAGGKGTRMRSSSLHKVCFPVDGRPAINRAIEAYNACGIRHHIVVVGALAGQVVETVGRAFDNVHFVYQREQLGTADAAEVGLRAVNAFASGEDVLLVPGDRLIEPIVLEHLFHTFYSGDCDLAFAATPPNRGSGRVVQGGDGAPLAIAEMADVRQRRVLAAQLELSAAPAEAVEQASLHVVAEGQKEVLGSEHLDGHERCQLLALPAPHQFGRSLPLIGSDPPRFDQHADQAFAGAGRLDQDR